MMNDSTATPAELVENVLAAARSHRGGDFSDELRDSINALTRNHPERLAARLEVASRLQTIESPIGAGFLAVWLGGGVEGGIDPAPTTFPILDAMLKWTRGIETPAEDSDADVAEPDVDTVIGLERLGQGLVAHLARSPSQLKQIAEHAGVVAELERVEHVSAGPLWVLELLRKRSGTLVVLDVASRRGLRVSYANISNNFHLFTLLQGAVSGKLPGAKRASKKLLAVARGEVRQQAYDSAWWHYGIATLPEANFAGSVWGEAGPDSIPAIDGQQVLLLWPKILQSRGWDAGFFGPFLIASPPAVTITEELTADQIDEWWAKLQLPIVAAKPWWKIW